MAVKVWHHTSLAVSDLDRAIEFYRRAFGYDLLFAERGMADQIARMTGIPGQTCDLAQLRAPVSSHVLELIAFRGAAAGEPKPLRPGAAHICFHVDDLEAALARVEGLGAVRLGEITRFDEGRSVYCREPAGSFFELEQLH
jgi:catechol 2,3-dioxygenase-like lactoylglutathione lyase family enzyme